MLIELSAAHYQGFLLSCDVLSQAYSILKNNIVDYNQDAGATPAKIKFECDEEEVIKLLYTAAQLYPQATEDIAGGIPIMREL